MKDNIDPDNRMLEGNVPAGFNYETVRTVPLDLSLKFDQYVMKNQVFELYADKGATDLLFTGVTDDAGRFRQDIVVPADVDEFYMKLVNEGEVASEGRTNSDVVTVSFKNGSVVVVVVSVSDLEISAVAIDKSAKKIKWRVRNPYRNAIKCKWEMKATAEYGELEAQPGDSYIETSWVEDCDACKDGESAINIIRLAYSLDGKTNVLEEGAYCRCEETYYYYSWPSCNRTASFAFEDLWPNTGDFDMNDVVVDMKYALKYTIVDRKGYAKALLLKYRLKYSGAGYYNGFAMQLPVKPEMIAGVKGTIDNDMVDLKYLSNGVEANQDQAVVVLFEDTRSLVDQYEYNKPSEVQELLIEFKEGIDVADIACKFPLKPFIFNGIKRSVPGYGDVNVREVEVHLPNRMPTNLADLRSFNCRRREWQPILPYGSGKIPMGNTDSNVIRISKGGS